MMDDHEEKALEEALVKVPSWRLRMADFESKLTPEETLRALRQKQGNLRRFYKKQNALIEAYAEIELLEKPPAAGSNRSLSRGEMGGDGSTGSGRASPGAGSTDAAEPAGASAGEQDSLGAADPKDVEVAPARVRKPRVDPATMVWIRRAVNWSFSCNVLLFTVKLIAAVASGSLGVVAVTIDSFLDLLSGSIVFVANLLARTPDPYKYPQGRSRLEPLGIVVFASVMGVASLQLVVQGVQTLLAGFGGTLPQISVNVFVIVVLGSVVVIKAALLVLCRKTAAVSSSVAALAQDHFNDVLSNGASILGVFLATEWESLWWVDAVVAVTFALYIVYQWMQTGLEQVDMLSGCTADPETLSQLTYLAFNHHPQVQAIDTVRAYHFGTRLLVEIDIVLDPEMPLRQAHDIGESLQLAVEKLPIVERCYVHNDFEWMHKPAHEHQAP